MGGGGGGGGALSWESSSRGTQGKNKRRLTQKHSGGPGTFQGKGIKQGLFGEKRGYLSVVWRRVKKKNEGGGKDRKGCRELSKGTREGRCPKFESFRENCHPGEDSCPGRPKSKANNDQ